MHDSKELSQNTPVNRQNPQFVIFVEELYDLTPDKISNPTSHFGNCPQLDVICVPGGGMGQVEIMSDRWQSDFRIWRYFRH